MFSRTAKRRMLAVVAVLAAVFVVAVVKARLIGQKPFRSWEKADIAQVELTLTPPDQSFVLTDAEAALEALGELNGKHIRDDLIQTIFSRFCVGK